MKIFISFAYVFVFLIASTILAGCDQQIPQTIVAKVDLVSPTAASVWLSPSDNCDSDRIFAQSYQDGLWIFRTASIRGGIGVTTQEIALCSKTDDGVSKKNWHSIHGGGSSLIIVSCQTSNNERQSCAVYQDGYSWLEPDE